MELLNFFNEALSVNRVDGSTILENGEVVIMDNCKFHLGQFLEAMLRDILQEHGVCLIFQLVYLWILFSPNKVLPPTKHIFDCESNWNSDMWSCIENNSSLFNFILSKLRLCLIDCWCSLHASCYFYLSRQNKINSLLLLKGVNYVYCQACNIENQTFYWIDTVKLFYCEIVTS